uniref:Dehydrogenase n=1 Tax=Glossina palpalis gambiensis TaxID=67801 RepID=A0A1B0AXA5_9MUSC
MERWKNSCAVVTGASAGIGAAITKELLKADLQVIGLARRVDRMEQLRSSLPSSLQSRLHVIKCDVADIESVNEAFDWIEEHLGGVDILINNAGVHVKGQLLTMNINDVEKTLQTNVMGMVYCARRAFNSMKTRNVNGHLILVNSIVGHNIFNMEPGTMPFINIYAMSKQATVAMTEVLRQEFREYQTNIKVTSISPGLVNTDLPPEEYKTLPRLQSEDVAMAVLYCLSTPPHVQVHELIIKPVGEAF